MIQQCHIRNYSIYLRQLDDGRHYLFSYFEYTGTDFAADMAKMAADPTTQRWWSFCKPCQQPLADRAPASGGPEWKRSSIATGRGSPRSRLQSAARWAGHAGGLTPNLAE